VPAGLPGQAAAFAQRQQQQQEQQQAGQGGALLEAEGGECGGDKEGELGDGDDDGDRAHAVPGVHAVEHDGVLGVPESLIDLEPLSDMIPQGDQQQNQQRQVQQQRQQQFAGSSSGSTDWAAAFEDSSTAAAAGTDLLEGEAVQPTQQQQDELISLDDDQPGPSKSSAVASAGVRSQFEDLLL
jgi:hypothetical protein